MTLSVFRYIFTFPTPPSPLTTPLSPLPPISYSNPSFILNFPPTLHTHFSTPRDLLSFCLPPFGPTRFSRFRIANPPDLAHSIPNQHSYLQSSPRAASPPLCLPHQPNRRCSTLFANSDPPPRTQLAPAKQVRMSFAPPQQANPLRPCPP